MGAKYVKIEAIPSARLEASEMDPDASHVFRISEDRICSLSVRKLVMHHTSPVPHRVRARRTNCMPTLWRGEGHRDSM